MGINSELKNGKHVIMWEFDETKWEIVESALKLIQSEQGLSTIYVARSHDGGGFHAYCLLATSWVRSIHIVSGTLMVDPGYINMCAMRGHWTLRLTDKGLGAPKHYTQLFSAVKETASITDLKSYVKYEAYKSKRIFGWGKRGI